MASSRRNYLPMENPATGELLVFVTGSGGGTDAVGTLVRTGPANLHKGLPIINLGVRSYKHRQYGRIENPEFQIGGWTGSVGAGVQPPSKHPVLDDEIPF